MQLQRTTILRGAMVGGLLTMAGLVAPAPAAQAAGGDYGTCCTIIVNVTPPNVTPPQVTPPQVTPPNVTPPQITQSVPVVPVGGGSRSAVSTGGAGSLTSVSPVSASVSPVSISARPAIAPPPPPPPPAPVSQVLGRTVEAPPELAPPPAPVAVVPRPIVEETAPRVVAPPEEIAETAPRTVQREVCIPGVGGAGLGPSCSEVFGRTVQGPGLVLARVLPKAGEGPSAGFAVWPPLALAGAALALALVALALPRRRSRAQVA
jgi:hypothetical protein